MKTPFTPQLKHANLPLASIDSCPFMPRHVLPFVGEEAAEHCVGGGCQISYRWHDAFDVFVAVLEAVALRPLKIPVASHLFDLHLIYQLHGESRFAPEPRKHPHTPAVRLREGHRMEVYTPPARATLQVRPHPGTKRYALAAVVPKRNWVTRHPQPSKSPMESLIQHLRQRHPQRLYLQPAPITPDIHAWLHVLLSTPPHPGMLLDDALNRPMVKLVEAHRGEYLRSERENRDKRMVEAARLLATELVERLDGGSIPTTAEIATALHTSERRIRELHKKYHNQRFIHYIHNCRMEESKKRLRSGLPVSAVAYQLGWSEHTNFTAQFRKYTGFIPTDFLRKRRL